MRMSRRMAFYSASRKLKYGGEVSDRDYSAEYGLAGAATQDYVLFSGGENDRKYYSNVNAFNKNGTKVSVTALPNTTSRHLGVTHNGHAVFAGGLGPYKSTVTKYDNSLTRSSCTSLIRAVSNLNGASNGTYLIIGGGRNSTAFYADVTAYNASFTRSTAAAFSVAKEDYGAAYLNGRVIFGGGTRKSPAYDNTVESYDTSLIKAALSTLSEARSNMGGGCYVYNSGADCAMFAGGESSGALYSPTIDVYNTSFTRSNVLSLSKNRKDTTVAYMGKYYLVIGGLSKNDDADATAEIFDKNLTRKEIVILISGFGCRPQYGILNQSALLVSGGGTGFSSSASVQLFTY